MYRQEVEKFAHAGQGKISSLHLQILEALRLQLGLLTAESAAIRQEVLKPYQEYNRKLLQYQQALTEAMRREYPFNSDTRNELSRLQEVLNLQDVDVASIEEKIFLKRQQSSLTNNLVVFMIGLSIALLTGIGSWLVASLFHNSQQTPIYPPTTVSEAIKP